MERFVTTDELRSALAAAEFDRPPALVANAHITGLSVARSLAAADVPVVAIDRSGDGVAPSSNAVDYAGSVRYPLADADAFREDVESIVDAAGTEMVAFACMDEWVHAFAETAPDGVRLPFSDEETIDRVLDKESLYRLAEALDVPYPETHPIDERSADAVLDALEFPFVVKPARKREFEEAIGTNVLEVADEEAFAEIVATAADEGIRIMAQEKVPIATGRDRSLGSYVPPSGVDDAVSVVGNPVARHPASFGTSCLVERVDDPEIEARSIDVLEETGYTGISEAEFVYDTDREEHVLLDINTRPWKWIGLCVAAGGDLPVAAYADATELDYERRVTREATWISLREYLARLSGGGPDLLSAEQWRALASGRFENDPRLTTAVHRPSDPEPTVQLLRTEFSEREYYCAC